MPVRGSDDIGNVSRALADSDELPITKSSEEYNSALNSTDAPLRCVLPSDVGRVSVGHPMIFQYFSPFEHRKHIFSIIGGNVTGA